MSTQPTPQSEIKEIKVELVPVFDTTQALVVTDANRQAIVATLTGAKEKLPALQRFAATVVISTQADYEGVAVKRKELKALQKDVEAALEEQISKAHGVHKAWTSLKSIFVTPSAEADRLMERKQSAFIQEQKRIAEELQAKLDREAKEKERIEREKQEALARRQREIEAAERQKAEEARRKQQEALETAQRAEAEARRKQLEAEQRAKAAEQEAIRQAAEAKNAKERERIQREAKEKAEKAFAEQQKVEAARKIALEAAEKERVRLAKEAEKAEAAAATAASKAEAREERAANVNIQAPTVVANTPENGRKRWKVKSIDADKFIADLARDPSLKGYIEINEGALIRSKGANPYFSPAGVVFIEDILVANRSK